MKKTVWIKSNAVFLTALLLYPSTRRRFVSGAGVELTTWSWFPFRRQRLWLWGTLLFRVPYQQRSPCCKDVSSSLLSSSLLTSRWVNGCLKCGFCLCGDLRTISKTMPELNTEIPQGLVSGPLLLFCTWCWSGRHRGRQHPCWALNNCPACQWTCYWGDYFKRYIPFSFF